MMPHVRALLARADEALNAARYNLEGGFVATAVNRSYYASFYAARAAVITTGESPKSHAGVLRRFLVGFVQSGRLDKEHGRVLSRAYQLRQSADYDDGEGIEPEAARNLIDDVAGFVLAVRTLLSDTHSE